MSSKNIISFLSSMKLTLFSLSGLLILVFVSTLAQVDMGIYEAKKHFFEGVFVYLNLWGYNIPVFLTGYVFGILILLNLCVVHFKRFSFKASKIGIWLIHSGLIVLIVGSGIVSSLAIESQFAIEEGQTKDYTQSTRLNEFIILKPLSPSEDQVISFPSSYLQSEEGITHPDVPFELKPIAFFENSRLGSLPENIQSLASEGLGTDLMVSRLDKTYNEKEKNMPSAFVEIINEGKVLGVWLISNLLAVEQEININGVLYRIILRPKRYYLGYSITLNDFTHDKYIGTETPKNFASKVSLKEYSGNLIQDALIYMNHPLRYDGKTFYQASFGKEDTLSVLQVVENPGWLLPYISSIMMSVGLLIHFMFHLLKYLRKKRR